jgi:tryptophan halogenase
MKVIIVGGGSSAWLSAAYLLKNVPQADITVIDKEIGNPVGVGEATILNFGTFMEECGFQKAEWFYDLDATLKTGIMFPGWGTEDNEVWHPFQTNVTYPDSSSLDVWAQQQDLPFKRYATTNYDAATSNLIDFTAPDQRFGYHVDCGKLVVYIQKKIGNFIKSINSAVTEVVKDDEENIIKLVLNNGEEHTADLYIDCTGFISLLKEQKFVDISGRLFCDTAIACRIDFEDKEAEMRPYVISEAVAHGWIWKIPTRSRIGSGLVFNRSITSIEEAKQYLSDHWNNRAKIEDMKVIDWTPRYCSNMWQGNVVSIGLSAGFIEPLESTGLFLIQMGIKVLAEKIKLSFYDTANINLYNAQMTKYFEDGIDFVGMHYANTERTEPFWQYVKETFKESALQQHYRMIMLDSNATFLDACKPNLTINTIFNPINWFIWLAQLGYPVQKSGFHLHPDRIKFLTSVFERNEHIRVLRSIPHQDAIDVILLEGINNGLVPSEI